MNWKIFSIIFLSALFLFGCRQSNQAQSDDFQVTLLAPVFPPAMGQGTVKVKVTNADGNPVNGLNVDFKGDMTHAGMVPVLATTSAGKDGVYEVPFEWTMAGDWVLTVNAQTEDHALIQERFNLFVDGDLPICGVDPEGEPPTTDESENLDS